MHEQMLCYDTLSGRYFTSSMDDILRAQNEVNKMSLDSPVKERYFDLLNQLRIKLDLPVLSEHFVRITNRPDGSLLDVKFIITTVDDGRPCVCVDFNIHKTKYKVKVRKKRKGV